MPAAVFEADITNAILGRTRTNREWLFLDSRENVDRDVLRLPKEIISCGSGGTGRECLCSTLYNVVMNQ